MMKPILTIGVIFAGLVILFVPSVRSLSATDYGSYCKGWCQARYQDGMYLKDRCACIDYYPINLDNRLKEPIPRPTNREEVYTPYWRTND